MLLRPEFNVGGDIGSDQVVALPVPALRRMPRTIYGAQDVQLLLHVQPGSTGKERGYHDQRVVLQRLFQQRPWKKTKLRVATGRVEDIRTDYSIIQPGWRAVLRHGDPV